MPHQKELVRYINLKLASMGQPPRVVDSDAYYLELAGPLLRNYLQKSRLLGGRLCPADARIQAFLDSYLGDAVPEVPKLPADTFTLDQPGLARVMSLPAEGNTFVSPYVTSYRVAQGVLHNPSSDRRTTEGVFHVAEGGLPVPADKKAVPKRTFAALLAAALAPPPELTVLPFTTGQEKAARLIVSLLLRPLVCPATGADPEKTMEIRFFAPASLVSNLDFVEGIFGNAGDPYVPENDAALDPMHWTGHTGCVIVAPHLAGVTRRDLGLPRWEEATERQRRDGMCWRDPSEKYNDGRPFKVTCRDGRGVIVTVIADNYFGYCKKEVKTQISYAANLFGLAEEEHAGGAVAFASYILGQDFVGGRTVELNETTFDQAMALLGDAAERTPGGYAVDRNYPDIYYVPENAEFSLREGKLRWTGPAGDRKELTLRARAEYVLPSGYRVRLEKQPRGPLWRLIGVRSDGTLCHKPSTVSGGGKSEISKSISNAILEGPIFVKDYRRDTEYVDQILKFDFTSIYRGQPDARARRPLLSPERSLGSVIKLLTPSPDYKDEYNQWLRNLPQTIRAFVCVLKRHYRPEWGADWRKHLTVDCINGFPGHELKLDDEKLVGNYLRVGFDRDGAWRIFKLRPDFHPAAKLQVEDDITASVVVRRDTLPHLDPQYTAESVKLVANCESLLFQRPDDAVHRGFDRQAEADIAGPNVFLSNFEPLSREQVREIVDHVVEFDKFTEPMKRLLEKAARNSETEWVVSSAHPRLVGGRPSKNPRYLQVRPDLANPRQSYLATVSTRLYREAPSNARLFMPVNAVLAGRRNNPPAPGIPPLAVYNPIHYQELPELFMDLICSLTGKSPSTTGFGSEGALTKRPFNALPPVIDVNNALVAAILTGHAGFTSAAGYVGPHYRVDHDISLLVPEIWCRMTVPERDPAFLIGNGFLEKLQDFESDGETFPASRLGYRITPLFVDRFLARIFETPGTVWPEDFLRPEIQDPQVFKLGLRAIVDAQRQVALEYFDDRSVEAACPPLRALLHIMAHGHYQGMTISDPAFRGMFAREALLGSAWYRERLQTKQERDVALWERHVRSLEQHLSGGAPGFPEHEARALLSRARDQLERVRSPRYLAELNGTIGADPRLGE